MAKQEQSFFALLTRYEKDNTLSFTDNCPYRYKWVKVNFNSLYSSSDKILQLLKEFET